MTKRVRIPKAKAGELRAVWGKADKWSGPDVCYVWGSGAARADARLLHNVLTTKRPFRDISTGKEVLEPGLIDELEARGYDITTLRFSIQMKQRTGDSSSRDDKQGESNG